ncbi:MAG: hypothetical protein PUC41_04235 [Oscillospiraceae bacterium]|nr:hypothetical protein [Oscillospiraceae bacterium]
MNRTESTSAPLTRSVYVVLTRTGTRVARVIRILTRKPYSHASISKDSSLQELFSFCRNNPRFPLPATFNEEYVGKGVFGLYDNIPCEIYEVPLTEAQYSEFCKQLLHFQNYRQLYSYSLLGLLSVPLQIQHELRYKFVCSQFVAYILQECNVKLDKPASLYAPEDLRHLPTAKLIYRGELNEYYSELSHQNSYELMHSAV